MLGGQLSLEAVALAVEYLDLARRRAMVYAKLTRHWDLLDDFTASAYIGLLDAACRFEGKRGYRFVTYAQVRIDGAIIDDVRRWQHIDRRNGEPRATLSSLDAEVGDQLTLADVLPDPRRTAEQAATERDLLRWLLTRLTPQQRFVIEQHYFGDQRMAQIGQWMGVTESRACQIHHAALELMRRHAQRDWARAS